MPFPAIDLLFSTADTAAAWGWKQLKKSRTTGPALEGVKRNGKSFDVRDRVSLEPQIVSPIA